VGITWQARTSNTTEKSAIFRIDQEAFNPMPGILAHSESQSQVLSLVRSGIISQPALASIPYFVYHSGIHLLASQAGDFKVKTMTRLFLVTFLPLGKSVVASLGTTLLDAALRAGISLPSTCNGQGDCGECSVLILEGNVSNPTAFEKSYLGSDALQSGQRLACCARINGSVRVFIPPSLSPALMTRLVAGGGNDPFEIDF
jgi:ferredoxin